VPPHGHLGDPDPRRGADNITAGTEYRGGRRRLGEHEHLDVEDPALGVHVGDDMGQGCAREQLEAALRVLDAGRGRGGQDCEAEVEAAHEKVAEDGALRGKSVSSR